MTEEQRLDRLERIVKLMVKAGLRARRQSREQDEKINILIDSQMKNEERLAVLSARTDEKFAAMAVAQASTQEQLKSFMATVERIITERRNGQP